MLHIHTFYKSDFKKIHRVQSHLFFKDPVSDITPQLQSKSSQRTKAAAATQGWQHTVHSQPARWRCASQHRLDRGCWGQSERQHVIAFTSPSPAAQPVLPAGPLGTGRHSDVVAPSPGSRPSWASLWAGLGQGLRGSLCPWYKSATMASQPLIQQVPRLRRPAKPGRALPQLGAEHGSGGRVPRGSCRAAGPRL